jgi:hypothetical protein
MPMPPRRRAERQARALLANAETLLVRAATRLAHGEALAAQRAARTAEQLLLLDSRLRLRRAAEAREIQRLNETAAALDARTRALDQRHADLNLRMLDLAAEADRLNELRESLDALYQIMFAKPPSDEPS